MRGTALLALLLLAGACADDPRYVRLDFEVQSTAPAQTELRSDSVRLVAGFAVKVRARIRSRDEHFERDDLLTLRPDDPALAVVYPGEERREFVLVGVAAGSSCLQVEIEGEPMECIALTVVPALK